MESFSTNLKCSFGGYKGRSLRNGDILETDNSGLFTDVEYHPQELMDEIRVINGLQYDKFTKKDKEAIFQESIFLQITMTVWDADLVVMLLKAGVEWI